MFSWLLTFPILLPLLFGGTLSFLRFEGKAKNIFTIIAVLLNSAVITVLLLKKSSGLTLFSVGTFLFSLQCDGLSRVFLGLIAFLWPLATLYAFEYMEHEDNQTRFFSFYTISYGVTAGVALSANFLTLYLFYELLTLVTLPLVIHEGDRRGMRAGRKYIVYSLGGAALSFAGIMILSEYGGQTAFAFGGLGNCAESAKKILLAGYLFTFFGFGVKAAIFPLHAWLPEASVAPTPVTALLHAVAVVNCGIFSVIRSTFYAFGPDILSGTRAQHTVMIFTSLTIVYGSVMALKEQHLKRRLAYSTVSNLSYILLGVSLMTTGGLTAALSHMLFHGIIKISLFLCCGAVICKTGREYIPQLEGLGRKMPLTFTSFLIASLALTGAPLLPGFISKMNLLTEAAALAENDSFAFWGIISLLLSAMLTAAYLIPLSVRAFLPVKADALHFTEKDKDPGLRMLIPFAILCVAMIVFGCCSSSLMYALTSIAAGA